MCTGRSKSASTNTTAGKYTTPHLDLNSQTFWQGTFIYHRCKTLATWHHRDSLIPSTHSSHPPDLACRLVCRRKHSTLRSRMKATNASCPLVLRSGPLGRSRRSRYHEVGPFMAYGTDHGLFSEPLPTCSIISALQQQTSPQSLILFRMIIVVAATADAASNALTHENGPPLEFWPAHTMLAHMNLSTTACAPKSTSLIYFCQD